MTKKNWINRVLSSIGDIIRVKSIWSFSFVSLFCTSSSNGCSSLPVYVINRHHHLWHRLLWTTTRRSCVCVCIVVTHYRRIVSHKCSQVALYWLLTTCIYIYIWRGEYVSKSILSKYCNYILGKKIWPDVTSRFLCSSSSSSSSSFRKTQKNEWNECRKMTCSQIQSFAIDRNWLNKSWHAYSSMIWWTSMFVSIYLRNERAHKDTITTTTTIMKTRILISISLD